MNQGRTENFKFLITDLSLERTRLLIAAALVDIPGSAPLLIWGLKWNATFGYVTKSFGRDTCFSQSTTASGWLLLGKHPELLYVSSPLFIPFPLADPKGQDQEWHNNSFQIVLKVLVSSFQMRDKWAKWNKWGRSKDVSILPWYLCMLNKHSSFF